MNESDEHGCPWATVISGRSWRSLNSQNPSFPALVVSSMSVPHGNTLTFPRLCWKWLIKYEEQGQPMDDHLCRAWPLSPSLRSYLRTTPRVLETGVVSLDPSRDSLHLPCTIMLIIYSASVQHIRRTQMSKFDTHKP